MNELFIANDLVLDALEQALWFRKKP